MTMSSVGVVVDVVAAALPSAGVGAAGKAL